MTSYVNENSLDKKRLNHVEIKAAVNSTEIENLEEAVEKVDRKVDLLLNHFKIDPNK